MKLACILRVADASHVHAGRAPSFLRALRNPQDVSRIHWAFQEKLQQPLIEGDRLVFTSATPFAQVEADAWWLCFDTLSMVSRELENTDALLADSAKPRLAARSIAGAGDAKRLARYVGVDGWFPVDAQLTVNNVAALIGRLGGKELYGDDPLIAVRELVQNAADALRARRIMEGRSADWGEVTVRLREDDEGHLLEVEDNGVGMSQDVLTGPFLDFGASYWGSPLMQRELPGLLAKGFESTGKYGIGFFATFMLGDTVQVMTRRPTAAWQDTLVLEFNRGLAARPILRAPRTGDHLPEGGTRVRVRLRVPARHEQGLLTERWTEDELDLEEEVTRICPALDANLNVQEGDETPRRIVSASDWMMLDGEELIARSWKPYVVECFPELATALAKNLRLITSPDGTIVARAAIAPSGIHYQNTYMELRGAVTCGGILATDGECMAGIMVGDPLVAARDEARPRIPSDLLAAWATEQAKLAMELPIDEYKRMLIAATVRCCGGDPGPLPVAQHASGVMNADQLREWAASRDEVILTATDPVRLFGRRLFEPKENVIWSPSYSGAIVNGRRGQDDWPSVYDRSKPGAWRWNYRSTLGAALDKISEAWSVSLPDLMSVPDEPVEVGSLAGEPYSAESHVLRRSTWPTAT